MAWARRARYLELAEIALKDTSMGIRCSQCGVVKGEVNHWFICWWSGRHFHTKPIDDDPAMQREAGVYTVCGDGCAHKVYQQFLDFLKNTQ